MTSRYAVRSCSWVETRAQPITNGAMASSSGRRPAEEPHCHALVEPDRNRRRVPRPTPQGDYLYSTIGWPDRSGSPTPDWSSRVSRLSMSSSIDRPGWSALRSRRRRPRSAAVTGGWCGERHLLKALSASELEDLLVFELDLAALAALTTSDQDRAAAAVQIGLDERERLTDPQSCAPEHDDDRAQSHALRPAAAGAHYGNDLLDARRVGRVVQASLWGRAPLVEAGQGRG